MKALLLFILQSIVIFCFAQGNVKPFCSYKNQNELTSGTIIPTINTRSLAQSFVASAAPQYDIQRINKNLKLDRRLIISGAVLTGAGGIIFGIGLARMFGARTDENFLAFALLMTGAPLIGVGVPLLSVGLAQRHKWRQRKNQLNLQTGILRNGGAGVVLNY